MGFSYQALTNPDRIRVTENGEWVATFTIGCYTVTLAGPARAFSERFRTGGATRKVTVAHSTWVRAAPGPVDANIDEYWLSCALAANHAGTPDALAIAMQYIKNAPPILLGDLQIAGDASYGPLLRDGTRDEGSDFNDYLGLRWLYPADAPDRPEANSIAVWIAPATCGWCGAIVINCRTPAISTPSRCRAVRNPTPRSRAVHSSSMRARPGSS